jgi:hypothetical protein
MRLPFRRSGAFHWSPKRQSRSLAALSVFLLPAPAFLAPTAPQADLSHPAAAASPAAMTLPVPVAGWSAPDRETLTYAVDWRVFPAGVATVHLQADGAFERITVTGDSRGAINLLFRVSDRFQSSFYRTTGCSDSFSRQIIEGRRQVDSMQRVDTTQHEALYSEHNLVSRIDVHKTAPLSSCVTDMLSSIYYGGSQTLEPGQSFHLPVLSGTKVSGVTMKVEGRETIHTPTATYQTLRVQPVPDSPMLRKRGAVWIWYSDDARHIPVQMRARLFWGTLTFRLTGIDNK